MPGTWTDTKYISYYTTLLSSLRERHCVMDLLSNCCVCLVGPWLLRIIIRSGHLKISLELGVTVQSWGLGEGAGLPLLWAPSGSCTLPPSPRLPLPSTLTLSPLAWSGQLPQPESVTWSWF